MRKTKATLLLFIILITGVCAGESGLIKLPSPHFKADRKLSQSLNDRKSSRSFASDALSLQELSNILWSANGINRPKTSDRTAPSAMNRQDIEVYAVLKQGIYLYNAKKEALMPVLTGDFRRETGTQSYTAEAPLTLLYVSDLSKLAFAGNENDQALIGGIDAGHCSQNVYLCCASEDLAAVTRTSIDRKKLSEILKLGKEHLIVMAQTIGHPKR